ncbi:MAG: SDR family oxidoreductase [Gammaproteobacteria bacterium]|nr:SDR family oxidoreductase [Gammaproteobacteria bacterium]
MEKKRALVTGGTGFLGRHLIEELLERGWNVAAFHRPSANVAHLRKLGVELRPGELHKEETLGQVISPGTDAVFHVAGDTSMWRFAEKQQYLANVTGTRNLLNAALTAGVGRFVHTSSVAVYGVEFDQVTEEAPHRGRDVPIGYFRTKTQAEEEVRLAADKGLDAVIVNPCNVVGPYDAHNWGRLIRMLDDGSLPGVPPGTGNFCHGRDVAIGHILAYEKGRTGENYLLGGTNASFLEAMNVAAKLLGKPEIKKTTPAALLKIVGRVSEWISWITKKEPELTPEVCALVCARQSLGSDKAFRELGYQSADMETMFRDCIEWLRKEGLLSESR